MDFVFDELANGRRLARAPVPQQRGLALVGDADGADVGGRQPGLGDGFLRGGQLRGPNLHRVVLDPAGLRKVLRQLALRHRDDAALRIEDDAARAGGALVQREDVAHLVSCEPRSGNLTDIRAPALAPRLNDRRWT
jgi:hypothetical protein